MGGGLERFGSLFAPLEKSWLRLWYIMSPETMQRSFCIIKSVRTLFTNETTHRINRTELTCISFSFTTTVSEQFIMTLTETIQYGSKKYSLWTSWLFFASYCGIFLKGSSLIMLNGNRSMHFSLRLHSLSLSKYRSSRLCVDHLHGRF